MILVARRKPTRRANVGSRQTDEETCTYKTRTYVAGRSVENPEQLSACRHRERGRRKTGLGRRTTMNLLQSKHCPEKGENREQDKKKIGNQERLSDA